MCVQVRVPSREEGFAGALQPGLPGNNQEREREWMGSPTLQTPQDPILLLPCNYHWEPWLWRPPNCLYRPGQPQMGVRVSSGINLIQ